MNGWYGSPPINCGRVTLVWDEFMHYLYLPVKLPGAASAIALPDNLRFVEPALDLAIAYTPRGILARSHIYVTARRGFATPDNPLNRPGWHCDGFGTDDINFVWWDRFSTRFAIQMFDGISDDHIASMAQFEQQVDPQRVQTLPDETLYRLDPYVVHTTPDDVPPGGAMRSFLKISVSPHRHNLKGNSHNHLLDYDWPMVDRDEIRNDPARYGRDYA